MDCSPPRRLSGDSCRGNNLDMKKHKKVRVNWQIANRKLSAVRMLKTVHEKVLRFSWLRRILCQWSRLNSCIDRHGDHFVKEVKLDQINHAVQSDTRPSGTWSNCYLALKRIPLIYMYDDNVNLLCVCVGWWQHKLPSNFDHLRSAFMDAV